MTAYTKGQRVQWRRDIPPRPGKQTGTVTLDIPDHGFPHVQWDDEGVAWQELPECVQPLAEKHESVRDAWTERRATR